MSKANDFKKGQKVIGKENVDSEIEEGKIYTVSKVEGDFIHCEELEYGHFYFYFKRSADEMFKELGYEKYTSKNGDKEKFIRNGLETILFDDEKKIVTAYIWNDRKREIPKILDMQELQAINEKVKELGW